MARNETVCILDVARNGDMTDMVAIDNSDTLRSDSKLGLPMKI